MKTTEPQKDLVVEARAKLAKPNYGMGKRNRELMTRLCDEVEELRRRNNTQAESIMELQAENESLRAGTKR